MEQKTPFWKLIRNESGKNRSLLSLPGSNPRPQNHKPPATDSRWSLNLKHGGENNGDGITNHRLLTDRWLWAQVPVVGYAATDWHLFCIRRRWTNTKPSANKPNTRAYSSGSGMIWLLTTRHMEPVAFAAKKFHQRIPIIIESSREEVADGFVDDAGASKPKTLR